MDTNQLSRDNAMVDLLRPEVEVRREIIARETNHEHFSQEDLVSMRSEADDKAAQIQGIANAYKAQIKDGSDGRYFYIDNHGWYAVGAMAVDRLNNIFEAARSGIRVEKRDDRGRAFVFDVDENDYEESCPF